MKKPLICFAAGCLGALVSSLVIWLSGDLGISKSLGVSIAPALTLRWLYPRIVQGGIWGLIFLLPMLNSRPFSKGSALSLFPTITQLFVVYPFMTYHGFAGLKLGLLTPVLVLLFNWIWGIVTSLTIRFSR